MIIRYLTQPLTSPEERLGNQLRSLLQGEEGRFDRFIAVVAFAKISGASRLSDALTSFRATGGWSSIIAGIDHRGTSRQAIRFLLERVDELVIYHDIAPSRTFHPKIYMIEERQRRASVILGSGNLTAGGLFTNDEAHLRVDLDLTVDQDRQFHADIVAYWESLKDPSSPCVLRVTPESIATIEPLLPDESATRTEDEPGSPESQHPGATSDSLATFFGSVRVPPAPPPDVPAGTRPPSAARRAAARAPSAAPSTPTGFWKMLSHYDASTTSSPGQIQIPISFRVFFPSQNLIQGPDPGGRGRMWEASFPVEFRDGAHHQQVPDARFIVYEPKTGHARPNTECRFTFHNRDILERLSRGDILLFRLAGGPNHFIVERIAQGDRRYRSLTGGQRRRWGLIF